MSKPKLNTPDVVQSTTLEPNTSITIGAYGTPESGYFENPTSPIPLNPTIEEVKKDWNNDDGDYSYAINLKPEEFEQDLELEAAGYEMIYWDKANREYTVSNGKIHFTVFDKGNGWCNFLRYYNGNIEELKVKKEWEDDGWEWIETRDEILLVFLLEHDHKEIFINKKDKKFACTGIPTNFITFKEHIRLTRTFRALKLEV